jgi:hypothetical protein
MGSDVGSMLGDGVICNADNGALRQPLLSRIERKARCVRSDIFFERVSLQRH